jgi:SNF2 family DNA or RNA helicase
MRHYRRLEEDMSLLFMGKSITAKNTGVLANKLLQAAGGAVYSEKEERCQAPERGEVVWLHDAKLDALEDIIESSVGNPVLIFYNFRHELLRIKERFSDRECRVLSTSQDIEDWNSGRVPIMLAHPASAGHGLNLQSGGNIIVWFSPTWSLELYQQANARLHRQGQEEHVIVNHIIARGTIDEDVMRVLQKKEVRQEDLLEAVKARRKRENSWRVKE